MAPGECDPEDGDLVRESPPVTVPREVEEAVRTLIRWAGDDPDREGLLDTPAARRPRLARICDRLSRGSRPPSRPDVRGGRRL